MQYETQSNENEIITTNLAKFGRLQLTKLAKLIKAMNDQGLPQDFQNNEVRIPTVKVFS